MQACPELKERVFDNLKHSVPYGEPCIVAQNLYEYPPDTVDHVDQSTMAMHCDARPSFKGSRIVALPDNYCV